MTGMAHPILGDSNIRNKLDEDDAKATSGSVISSWLTRGHNRSNNITNNNINNKY